MLFKKRILAFQWFSACKFQPKLHINFSAPKQKTELPRSADLQNLTEFTGPIFSVRMLQQIYYPILIGPIVIPAELPVRLNCKIRPNRRDRIFGNYFLKFCPSIVIGIIPSLDLSNSVQICPYEIPGCNNPTSKSNNKLEF